MRMCVVLKVSRSGYYKYLSNTGVSVSSTKRAAIIFHARVFHKRSKGIYGYRKVHEDFEKEFPEVPCSRETVHKVMRENNLFNCVKKKHRYPKPDNSKVFEYPKNKLNKNYNASIKNLKWTGDITYIRTTKGWVYLAVVMDLFSRKIIGWSMSTYVNSALTCQALENAIEQRDQSGYLLYHSDRGSQYSSYEFQGYLLSNSMESSMSLKGDPWSNAVNENFFQKLKHEFIRGRVFKDIETARSEIFWYIEIFYNKHRRNQYLGYLSPVEYEKRHEIVA